MQKTIQSTTTLNDGVEIPYLGLGTWQSRGAKCEKAVTFALNHGYTLIDTAQIYENEGQVGKGWKVSSKSREDIFITTKIWTGNQGYESSQRSLIKSLKALQTDYVDLLLIHWPNVRDFSRTIATWQAMVEMREKGLCRSIGVSNFTIPLIEDLLKESDVVPSTNQVECHISLYQKELLDYCRAKNIQIEAYSPLARGKFLNNELLVKIADKYNKTPAQVMLAWCLNHDLVTIPKSVHEGRILENADVFFDLEEEDMQALNGLGSSTRLIKGFWAPPTW